MEEEEEEEESLSEFENGDVCLLLSDTANYLLTQQAVSRYEQKKLPRSMLITNANLQLS